MKCIALKDFGYSYSYASSEGHRNDIHDFNHKKGEKFYGYDNILKKQIKLGNCKELIE